MSSVLEGFGSRIPGQNVVENDGLILLTTTIAIVFTEVIIFIVTLVM